MRHVGKTAIQSLIFCTVGDAVKFTSLRVVVVLLLLGICIGQSSRPVPAGMRHAQELEEQNESDAPSPVHRSVNRVELQNQANQLADLAASMPQAVQNANKGLLDKDLVQRLKQIEKLAKQLRTQLDH
jgi:hypothetical protein